MPLIIVGAVTRRGRRSSFSQGRGDQLSVSAPGKGTCAGRIGNRIQYLRGASFCRFLQTLSTLLSHLVYSITSKIATPAVAGVAAYFLSLEQYWSRLRVRGQVAANVKKLIVELAHSRILDQPLVVWNGEDPRGLSCASGSGPKDGASGSGTKDGASGSGTNDKRQAMPLELACAASLISSTFTAPAFVIPTTLTTSTTSTAPTSLATTTTSTTSTTSSTSCHNPGADCDGFNCPSNGGGFGQVIEQVSSCDCSDCTGSSVIVPDIHVPATQPPNSEPGDTAIVDVSSN
jgi:hypothetical protein